MPRKTPHAKKLPKEKSVSQLKKEADLVFSHWIRNRDKWQCFTCGKRGDKFSIQNGHYVSRSHNSLRFSERNCNAQCVGCNIFRRGNMDSYALQLVKRYGSKILQELATEKRKIKQFDRKELQAIIERYKFLPSS